MADSVFSWRETAKDVAASFMGAASCCFVGQPFDTIKVRMQSRPTEFTGMVQGTLKTVRAEGVLALWKGEDTCTILSFGGFERNSLSFDLLIISVLLVVLLKSVFRHRLKL